MGWLALHNYVFPKFLLYQGTGYSTCQERQRSYTDKGQVDICPRVWMTIRNNSDLVFK